MKWDEVDFAREASCYCSIPHSYLVERLDVEDRQFLCDHA
jgi:hypothetical protein